MNININGRCIKKIWNIKLLCGLVIGIHVFAMDVKAETPLKADSKQPVDITADALEVRQDQQIAIFTGNVVASQGEMKLTSQVMKVYYNTQENKPKTPKSSQEQSISKIEVEGNVYLTTQQETARGKSGVYDVAHERLTLNGDVVLTRGESIVKGDSLEYDLATGRSRIIGSGVTAESLKNGAGSGKAGRVRGRFVPEKKSPDKEGSSKEEPLKETPDEKQDTSPKENES